MLLALNCWCKNRADVLNNDTDILFHGSQMLFKLDLVTLVDGLAWLEVLVGLLAGQRPRLAGGRKTNHERVALVVQQHSVIESVES